MENHSTNDDGYNYYISDNYHKEIYLRRVDKKSNYLWYYCTTEGKWNCEFRAFVDLTKCMVWPIPHTKFLPITKEEALVCTLLGKWDNRKLQKTYVSKAQYVGPEYGN